MTFRGPFHLYAWRRGAQRFWTFENLEEAREMRRECSAKGWNVELIRVNGDKEEEID